MAGDDLDSYIGGFDPEQAPQLHEMTEAFMMAHSEQESCVYAQLLLQVQCGVVPKAMMRGPGGRVIATTLSWHGIATASMMTQWPANERWCMEKNDKNALDDDGRPPGKRTKKPVKFVPDPKDWAQMQLRSLKDKHNDRETKRRERRAREKAVTAAAASPGGSATSNDDGFVPKVVPPPVRPSDFLHKRCPPGRPSDSLPKPPPPGRPSDLLPKPPPPRRPSDLLPKHVRPPPRPAVLLGPCPPSTPPPNSSEPQVVQPPPHNVYVDDRHDMNEPQKIQTPPWAGPHRRVGLAGRFSAWQWKIGRRSE